MTLLVVERISISRIELTMRMTCRRVSCDGWHTVVVTKSGVCYSFGRGEYGRLGLGDTKSRYVPKPVSSIVLVVYQQRQLISETNCRLKP